MSLKQMTDELTKMFAKHKRTQIGNIGEIFPEFENCVFQEEIFKDSSSFTDEVLYQMIYFHPKFNDYFTVETWTDWGAIKAYPVVKKETIVTSWEQND